MKAWRMYGIADMRLDDVPMPEIKSGWALVKMRLIQVGITETQQILGQTGRDRIEKLLQEGPRQMFGHEFCGSVVEVGQGVSNVKVGDRVTFTRAAPCHNCEICSAGYEELCHKGPRLGVEIAGCLAEYELLPAESIMSIPDSVTDSEAQALHTLVGTVGDVYLTKIEMGDTVAVLGPGVMGLTFMQVSRVCGAGKIIAVASGNREQTLELASQLGADIVINAKKRDPVEAALEATSGVGVDVVFECAGGSPQEGLAGTETLSQAFKMVRDNGKICQVAVLEHDAKLDIASVVPRGIQYIGHGAGSRKLDSYALQLLISKRVQLAPVVTHTLKGLDKLPEAIEITANKAKYGAMYPAQVILT